MGHLREAIERVGNEVLTQHLSREGQDPLHAAEGQPLSPLHSLLLRADRFGVTAEALEDYQVMSFAHGFLFLVAGPGIEPGSGGYEPPEVPLLHPAMF